MHYRTVHLNEKAKRDRKKPTLEPLEDDHPHNKPYQRPPAVDDDDDDDVGAGAGAIANPIEEVIVS